MSYDRKDFKLRFSNENTKFFINEKKGVITCVLESELVCPYSYDSMFFIPSRNFKSVGIAKCNAEDVFNENRGKRIALAKAENKAYMEAFSYLSEKFDELLFLTNSIQNFNEKMFKCCAHNEDYIDSLSYEAHPKYKKELKPFKERN